MLSQYWNDGRQDAPKISVLHYVSTYLFRNGTWIYSQISNLRDICPIIACNKIENIELFPTGRVYCVDNLNTSTRTWNKFVHRLVGYYPDLLSAAIKEQVRVIHAHFGPGGFECLRLAAKCNVPLVTTFYGYDVSQLPQQQPYWRNRYQRLFAEGTMFLAEGPHMRQQLIELGCPDNKVYVQPLGVDLNRIKFLPRVPSGDGETRILMAATFTEKKGLVYGLRAFAELCKCRPNVRMTVVGDARNRVDEQEIKSQLESIIASSGIQDRVDLVGFQSHESLLQNFYAHHIFLSPSIHASDGDNEGGAPVTIIEASASGMPVVSTTHCDIPSVIRDGESGYLVSERDSDGLCCALKTLIDNPDAWIRMGHSARRHIESRFDVTVTAKLLENRYCSMIHARVG